MIKKDPIFWLASAVFFLALLLFAVTKEQLWLFLMIISYMLRPTLASLGAAKRHVDERQMSIYYRSGNIGFAVMIICCVIFAIKLSIENNHDFELFIAAIIIGLAAKALFNVILIKNFRETASRIIIGVGLLVALFASFDAGSFTGIIISILPGLIIAGIGLLAKKYPRIISIVIIVIAIASMIFILTFKKGWGQVVAAAVIGIPLLFAGIGLFQAGRNDANASPGLSDEN
jgi:hypothetical protein